MVKSKKLLEEEFEFDALSQTAPREGLDALGTTTASCLAFISLSKNLAHAIPVTEIAFSGLALTSSIYDLYQKQDKGVLANAGNIGKSIISILTMAVSFGLIFQLAPALMLGLVGTMAGVGLATGAAELYNNKIGENKNLDKIIKNLEDTERNNIEKKGIRRATEEHDPKMDLELIEAQLAKKSHISESKANVSAIASTTLTVISMSLPFIFPATAIITIIELIALLVPAAILAIGSAKYANDANKIKKLCKETKILKNNSDQLSNPIGITAIKIIKKAITSPTGYKEHAEQEFDFKKNNPQFIDLKDKPQTKIELKNGEIFINDVKKDKYDFLQFMLEEFDGEVTLEEKPRFGSYKKYAKETKIACQDPTNKSENELLLGDPEEVKYYENGQDVTQTKKDEIEDAIAEYEAQIGKETEEVLDLIAGNDAVKNSKRFKSQCNNAINNCKQKLCSKSASSKSKCSLTRKKQCQDKFRQKIAKEKEEKENAQDHAHHR